MGYGELVSLCREAGVRDLELLEDEGRGAVSRIELKDRLDGDQLDAIESVDDWELIDERAGSYRYLLEVTALELPEDAVVDHDDLVGMCDPTVSDHGLLLSLVGTQESIRAMLRNFEAARDRPRPPQPRRVRGRGTVPRRVDRPPARNPTNRLPDGILRSTTGGHGRRNRHRGWSRRGDGVRTPPAGRTEPPLGAPRRKDVSPLAASTLSPGRLPPARGHSRQRSCRRTADHLRNGNRADQNPPLIIHEMRLRRK